MMQTLQPVPFSCQKARHSSALVYHLSGPGLLAGVGPSAVRSPLDIAPAGHASAHWVHFSHVRAAAKHTGWSHESAGSRWGGALGVTDPQLGGVDPMATRLAAAGTVRRGHAKKTRPRPRGPAEKSFAPRAAP